MRIVRFGPEGAERYGLLDDSGTIRDASSAIGEDAQDFDRVVAALGRLKPADLPAAPEGVRLGCPVARVGKVVCVGLNYSDHAAETNMAVPVEPVLFMKANTSVCGPNDDIRIPPDAEKVDWEVELGVVIGRRATRVSEADAMDYVAGLAVVHDVSERGFQLEGTGQWLKGKSLDTFCPVGPWLVTRDEAGDPQNLAMYLDVNGQRMQDGSTRTMVFGVAFLVSYISRFMTLEPGDIISTGTPPGVGMGKQPPVYLKPGDKVALGIEGLGTQQQTVRLTD
ncbi:MAG: fumarylacetoacetate hydrolase family protein [Sphingomonadales bacterium]|nr:fumarylacetoacetate hydrolase family protein [Sphingomonadales bacterium]